MIGKTVVTLSRGLLKILGLGVVLALTLAIFRLPIVESSRLIWEGAFGDKFALSRTIIKATPMIFTGIGMTVAWRAGAYNIGGEGQFILGGLAGAAFAKIGQPAIAGAGALFALPILVASAMAGAAWSGIAGWLQIKRGVEAVISTILLNYIALQLMSWLIQGPLQERAHVLPQTEELPSAVMLFRPDKQMDLNLGTLLALAAAVAVYIYLFKSKAGFLIRVVGSNKSAARANRINVDKAKMQAFLVSGALCGLAGGVEYVGVAGLVGNGFNQNWGFLGIPVALLAGLHPLGVIASGLYFGALLAGSENLGRFTSGGPTLVYVVQAAAVLAFVGFSVLKSPGWLQRRRS